VRQAAEIPLQLFEQQADDPSLDRRQRLDAGNRRVDLPFARRVAQHDDVGLVFALEG
jgi:hypothetical protein